MAKKFEELRKELYRKDPGMKERVERATKEMIEETREFQRMFASQLEELMWDPKFRSLLLRWMKHVAEREKAILAATEELRAGKGRPYRFGVLRATRQNLRIIKQRNRNFLRTTKFKRSPKLPVFS